MGTIDLGASVKSTWAGAPAGGTHAVSITRPDGTSFASPGISGPPVSATFTPDMAGRWSIRWLSTVVPGAYVDIVNVWPTDPRFIISVDAARSALNLPPNADPNKLDDLRLYIAAATPVIEDIVGPVVVKAVTQKVQKGWSFAALYERPTTLSSVIGADGTVYNSTHYTFDEVAGLLTFYTPTTQVVTVTHTVGTAIVGPNIQLATRELVRHWWQIGMQAGRAPGVPAGTEWTPSGFAVPRRVIELCAPADRVDGFA